MDKDRASSFPLPRYETNYIEENNSVEIMGDNAGLQYLCDLIQKIINQDVPGSNFNVDHYNGMDGNVKTLIFMKKDY